MLYLAKQTMLQYLFNQFERYNYLKQKRDLLFISVLIRLRVRTFTSS